MKVIIANWKSNKSLLEAKAWLKSYAESSAMIAPTLQVVVAPSMPLISSVAEVLKDLTSSKLELGVQDLSPFPPGSYTGATSTKNLDDFNVRWAILGHSERRRYFHETHQQVANKVEQALGAGIMPVVCVDQPDIAAQMVAIDESWWPKIMVAYEPLGAIGSGNEEPVSEVEKVVALLKEKYHVKGVIYGGSVSAGNVDHYLAVCDGTLVATHSLEVSDFISLLQVAD